ncbi:18968_t:CDS:2, partial [Funneliformis geosporum]
KKFDEKTWNTFITLAYCNKVLSKHETKWKVQKEKARKWIHEVVKDEKLEKDILESCEKVVVEKVSDKKKQSSSWFTSVEGYLNSTTKHLDDDGSDEKSFPVPANDPTAEIESCLFLDKYGIQPIKLAIFKDDGKLNISSYNEQPIVYTIINDPDSTTNLLNFDTILQPSDVCINFSIAEIAYNGVLSEAFANEDENLNELYGHHFARKVTVG